MMKSEIYDFIEINGGAVTFVELQNRIKNSKGESTLEIEGERFSNVLLWAGVSSEFFQCFNELMNENKIISYPTTPLVYMHDGGMLDLPIAKKATHYKEPHWLPVVLWTNKQAKKRGFFEKMSRKNKKECHALDND